MEIRIERQIDGLGAMAPTRYGLTSPSSTDQGQKAKVRLVFTVRSLLADFHVTVEFLSLKEGRSQGGGRKPSRMFF